MKLRVDMRIGKKYKEALRKIAKDRHQSMTEVIRQWIHEEVSVFV